MNAILYPSAVEKKRLPRILCGFIEKGTIKGHKTCGFRDSEGDFTVDLGKSAMYL
jgi:hypothetical protein